MPPEWARKHLSDTPESRWLNYQLAVMWGSVWSWTADWSSCCAIFGALSFLSCFLPDMSFSWRMGWKKRERQYCTSQSFTFLLLLQQQQQRKNIEVTDVSLVRQNREWQLKLKRVYSSFSIKSTVQHWIFIAFAVSTKSKLYYLCSQH